MSWVEGGAGANWYCVPGIGVGDEAHRARAAVGDLDRLEMAALVVIKRRGVVGRSRDVVGGVLEQAVPPFVGGGGGGGGAGLRRAVLLDRNP